MLNDARRKNFNPISLLLLEESLNKANTVPVLAQRHDMGRHVVKNEFRAFRVDCADNLDDDVHTVLVLSQILNARLLHLSNESILFTLRAHFAHETL